MLKYNNCNEVYKVNSSECTVFKALKLHSVSADSLAMNKKWVI